MTNIQIYDPFINELTKHGAHGYHVNFGKLNRDDALMFFKKNYWSPCKDYITLMTEVGPGSFFGGALQIFSLTNINKGVLEWSQNICADKNKLICIGYDGTTNGCYAIKSDCSDNNIYYYEWEEGFVRKISHSLTHWINSDMLNLFSEKTYKNYRPVKNYSKIMDVIKDRQKIFVKVVSFDKKLCHSPEKKYDVLTRYNKVKLSINISESVSIKYLTIELTRTGSKLGDKNIFHHVININNFMIGENIIEIYFFDPFNLPFVSIVSSYKPVIDLSKKNKALFKEIEGFI